MLQYDINSWHYKLVLYIFGNEFFTDKYIDHSMLKTDEDIEKMFKSPDEFSKTKPKRVNFCPYCRAVVASIFLFPFSILYKILPKRKPKKLTNEERIKKIHRNSKIIQSGIGAFNIAIGLNNIINNDFLIGGILQIIIGVGFIFFSQVTTVIKKCLRKFKSPYNKIKKFLITVKILRTRKTKKQTKPKPTKSPNFVKAFFSENHYKYCPPVFFVDKKELK